MAIKYLDADEDPKKTELRPAVITEQGVKVGELGDHHNDIDHKPPENNRGFVDNSGQFLNREEASKVAKSEGHDVPAQLHSEDLNKATGIPDKPAGKVKFLDEPQSSAPASQRFAEDAQPTQTGPSFWERFGTGLKDIGVAASQSGAHIIAGGPTWLPGLGSEKMAKLRQDLVTEADKSTHDREERIQAERAAGGQEGVDWGRTLGNIVGTLPLASLNPSVAGAAAGALTPVTDGDFVTEKAEQIGLGAVGGKLADMGGNLLAKAARPVTDAAKKALLEAGVELTPGLAAGKVGKTVEKMMKTLPFTGDLVRSGESHTLDTFDVATAKKALMPLGKDVVEGLITAKTGREAVQQGQKLLEESYDKTLDKIGQFKVTPKFIDSMNELEAMSAETMPRDLRNQYISILRNRIGTRLQGPGVANGTMDGHTFKQVESELRTLAQGFKGNQDQGVRQIGHAIDAARDHLRDALAEQNPKVAKELQKVNHAYALFGDVERAAQQSATSKGQFTPAELLQAIKVGDKSSRNRQLSAGRRPLQDWAEKAHSVLGGIERSKENQPWTKSNVAGIATGLAGLPLAAGHTETGMAMLRNFMVGAPKTRNLLASVAQGAGQIAAPAAAGAAAMLPEQGNNP